MIEVYAKQLKLPYLKKNYSTLLQQAIDLDQSFEEFLTQLLMLDMDSHLEVKMKKQIKELKTLRFIDQKENLILMGNPGVGKTHLATVLGMEACLSGKSVLFTNIPNLVIELKESMSANQLNFYKRRFGKYDLVILDELGYVSFDQIGSEILFNLLSNAGSMIITTNLSFDRWEETFKDPMLTAAMVDRLAHRAHVLDLSGPSFRVEDTKKWLN